MHRRTSSRRQFLRGHSAVEALADVAQALPTAGAATEQAEPAGDHYLVQFGRRAMACRFEAFLNAGQYPQASDVVFEALDLVDRLEAQLTVYRDTSELMRINRSAGEGPVEVEPALFALIAQAVQLHDETQGAFDVTSGPLSKVWGFYRRAGALPGEAQLAAALDSVGSRWLDLDSQARTVRLGRPGMELNLGAIGKGYALDQAARLMLSRGIDDFLWHAGSSSVLARGNRSGAGPDDAGNPEQSPGWIVALDHPMRPGRRLAEIRLVDRALGTSGSGTQFFRHRGRRYGHILDPRTGRPAEGVISSTVVAPTAAEADALATAFYILGPQQAQAWCQRHPEVGMLMLVPSPDRSELQVVSAGLAAADCRWITQP
ncbi:MAG: FAD:protein FMN transferase [Pirellulales bacterium]